MRLSFFILQHKKKIRGHEMLTHTFTKSIEDKTNQSNNNRQKKTIEEKRQKTTTTTKI